MGYYFSFSKGCFVVLDFLREISVRGILVLFEIIFIFGLWLLVGSDLSRLGGGCCGRR